MADIDPSSPVPKYHQLKEIIRGMVEEGGLGEGRLVPSGRELCERHPVGRMTARQAVVVDEAEAGHLGVPVGSPALLIERLAFDADGRPFEYVRSTHRADRYRVTARLNV